MRFLFIILTSFTGLLLSTIHAQVKSLPAVKITQPIKIDGELNDEAWKNVDAVGDFITFFPEPGKPSNLKTFVKITYDNEAVYVGAYMYDKPEDIRKQITARDGLRDVDVFIVGFDTYKDRQNT